MVFETIFYDVRKVGKWISIRYKGVMEFPCFIGRVIVAVIIIKLLTFHPFCLTSIFQERKRNQRTPKDLIKVSTNTNKEKG